MPFTRRPDTFLVLSGPKPANRTGNTDADIDLLSGFVSEAQPSTVAAPVVAPAVAAPVVAAPVVTAPVAVSPARRAAVGSIATTWARLRPPFGKPPTLAAAAAAAAFIVIAVASATAVIIAVLGGADRPSTHEASIEVPSTNVQLISPAVTPKAPPATLAGPVPPSGPRRAVNGVAPDPPPQSSPLATTANGAVGTTGRRTAVPNQSTKTSRAAASSYRGSLAIRSAPQGARVFVNGALVGSTPLELANLPVGSRAVRIEADGYERWSASARVVANRQTRLSATLARAKP